MKQRINECQFSTLLPYTLSKGFYTYYGDLDFFKMLNTLNSFGIHLHKIMS